MRLRFPRALPFLALVAWTTTARAGPVEEARALAREDRPAEAAAALSAHLAEFPRDSAALVALGEVERLRCRLASAEEAYRRALERNLADPGARAGLAEVLLVKGRAAEALGEAQAGIDGAAGPSSEDARPWRAKALALMELRQYDLAVEAARRAVAIAPYNARCHEALAAAEFRAGRMDAARESYLAAVAIDPRTEEANLRLGNGFADACDGKPWREGVDATAFGEAVALWESGDLPASERRWLALTRKAPGVYKYRLGLGLVRLAARRRNEATLGGDAASLYRSLPAPEVEDLAKVVRGYDGLDEIEKSVVRIATAPAAPLWGALVAAGVTHDLFPVSADLTDDATRKDLQPQKTSDGRWYAHLRGVGGERAATGTEKLHEAAEFAFNTFAHEFGHQVLRMGLSPERQKEVEALYAAAVKEKRTLDYYSATNADEYFAQGYEAFVSPVKRGCLTETARHTRDELAAKDPPLYRWLLRVLDTSYESPEAFARLKALANRSGPVRFDPSPEPAAPR